MPIGEQKQKTTAHFLQLTGATNLKSPRLTAGLRFRSWKLAIDPVRFAGIQ
jgi:hypothetical protein